MILITFGFLILIIMSNLIAQSEEFVLNLLSNELDKKYVYHNFSHTQRVVKKVIEIAKNYNLNDVETQNLTIAAWFHDTGFIIGAQNHEEESVKIVTKFL
ncbi:MAG: phosphohydrolase, partial [Polaribacter sp.]|nr:phosphohydrolase [Polaribacter sp.]